MSPLDLLVLSLSLYLIGALATLLFKANEPMAYKLSGVFGAAGGVVGVVLALGALLSGEVNVYQLPSPFYFADLIVRIDLLGAFMIGVISLIVIAASIYSLSYMQEYEGKGAWAMGFFLNLFIASMVALVVCDNAFYFIVLFEAMSLASYFLVIGEQSEKGVKAGLQYFLYAHGGSVLIMIAFFLMYREAGSLNFDAFRQLSLDPTMASIVFLLAFFGFGAKAGIITLHGWLPQAHPAAPSHASALMSGVMVKVGVFGIIKVGIDLLGADLLWWGYMVLAFGAVSSVLGVLYALAEHDIKRLLAYHTVENIGIILMGVGVGMIGLASGNDVIAALGLLGGLYHLLNHAVFKGLLFLGAGSMIYRVHTKDMDSMGGLGKLMPYTAIAFLIGTMAISALPPLNGFVSEWFIYQSLISMSKTGDLLMTSLAPVAVIMLALTGALACMCFVKVYGICFAGAPKTQAAAKATEVPLCMNIGTMMLALMCIILGIGSPWIAPVISSVAAELVNSQAIVVQQGAALVPVDGTQAILSTPVIAVTLIALLMVPAAILRLFRGQKMARRVAGDPWACGYAVEDRMTVSAGSFTSTLRAMYEPLYRIRNILNPANRLLQGLTKTKQGASQLEPQLDNRVVMPTVRLVQALARRVQVLQRGDFRVYCMYIVVALFVLLIIPVELGVN
ncbi:hydrogenase 4 subunit B [Ferrimonas lipolytica]|uniref:Hydrogenase 4 subunit B n=1 Tax=Ferrimonas lipolytica TaxID=2724191 RepID=A0A6H1UD02_9GAMM|nr:hydrogenase 4 subunit B [Ferrimonas lipolytica]QIZ76233.1 hydrogenase 4 subunit B [Ferrimonas lipolytica]